MLGTQDVLQQMCGMAPEVLAANVPGLKARYQPDQFCDTVWECGWMVRGGGGYLWG